MDRLLLLLALGAGAYPLFSAKSLDIQEGVIPFVAVGLLGTLLIPRWPRAWALVALGCLPLILYSCVTLPLIVVGWWAPLKVLGAVGFQLWACGRISGGVR